MLPEDLCPRLNNKMININSTKTRARTAEMEMTFPPPSPRHILPSLHLHKQPINPCHTHRCHRCNRQCQKRPIQIVRRPGVHHPRNSSLQIAANEESGPNRRPMISSWVATSMVLGTGRRFWTTLGLTSMADHPLT
jgi:hypothetical protein